MSRIGSTLIQRGSLNPQNGSLQSKTSFYYPFLLLPKKKRLALEILYRFCWAADEISDNPGPIKSKKIKLQAFKKNLEDCFNAESLEPLFQKLQSVVQAFGLSPEPLRQIVAGVEKDLKPIRFKTFAELHRYALQVAGGPGLASMEIFGFKDKAHRTYALNLGVFLQLVNMVRDYKEDKEMGRIYLPSTDFKRFNLNPLALEENNSYWPGFVDFQLERAWSFLQAARGALTQTQRADLATAEAIAAVYIKLFQKLKSRPHSILKGRISLTKADKALSLAVAAGRCLVWKVLWPR